MKHLTDIIADARRRLLPACAGRRRPGARRPAGRALAALGCIVLSLGALSGVWPRGQTRAAATALKGTLRLNVYAAGEEGWCSTATLIYGRSEALLVDSLFLQSDAAKFAEQIAATGTRLKAIIVTHPHDDHYMGLATLHERFPAAPIYMTAAGLEEFKRGSPRVVAWLKKNMPAEAPGVLPTPEVFAAQRFLIDGQAVEVMEGRGDEAKAGNSYVWIPSLRAVVAGDMVFNGVHAWLADSDAQSRAAWLASLERLAALHPRIVVAGHKKSPAAADTPEAIAATGRYLRDFDAAAKTSADAAELFATMRAKYPDLGLADKILRRAVNKVFPKAD